MLALVLYIASDHKWLAQRDKLSSIGLTKLVFAVDFRDCQTFTSVCLTRYSICVLTILADPLWVAIRAARRPHCSVRVPIFFSHVGWWLHVVKIDLIAYTWNCRNSSSSLNCDSRSPLFSHPEIRNTPKYLGLPKRCIPPRILLFGSEEISLLIRDLNNEYSHFFGGPSKMKMRVILRELL